MAPQHTPVMAARGVTSDHERPGRKRKHSSLKTSTRRRNSTNSESEEVELDSDALDESDDVQQKRKKPKRTVPSPSKSKRIPKRKSKKKESDESDEERPDLQDGQEVVGKVVKAPTTGLGMPLSHYFIFILTLSVPRSHSPCWTDFTKYSQFPQQTEGSGV